MEDELERHSTDLIRRSQRANPDWFQRHWLGLMVLMQLALTILFVAFAAIYGFTSSTIFFGAIAGYNLTALLIRLIYGNSRASYRAWRRSQ